MSYRRSDDEDEDSSVPPPSVVVPCIQSETSLLVPSVPEVEVVEEVLGNKQQPIQIEPTKITPSETSTTSDDVDSVRRESEPVSSIPRRDYSRWTTQPRPASVKNEGLERLIAWSQSGNSINTNLRGTREFRNPSMLSSLVNMCGIREKGSNIPKEKSGLSFLPSDEYSALINAQEAHLAARVAYQQPGKRTAIEFVKRPSENPQNGAPQAKRYQR